MTFKTICVKSANRLCSKQRKGFGSKTLKQFCKSEHPTGVFFPCALLIFSERGYAPNENQVIVLSQLAKVLSNFLYLAIEQSTSLAEMRIFHK